MTDKEIRVLIEKRRKDWRYGNSVEAKYKAEECDDILELIDSMQEEPVSGNIDFEQELYKAFGQVKDFTLGMRIAKWFYDMGKNSQEPVSEDLDEAADNCYFHNHACARESFIEGANWQKEQMMAKAFDYTKEHNTACVLASECLRGNGWFSRERDFNDLFRHLSCVDELFEGKFSGKTKVIVIKED